MKKILSKKNKRKQRNFRIHIIFGFVISILLFKGIFVQAGMNDSRLEKNRVDGVYAVTTLNGVQHLYYLNMYTLNGVVSYCIELGTDITSDIYHSTDDFGLSYLSEEKIRYIQLISYFGYLYPSHDDYRYYMAAQELIWEYLSGVQVEWTNELDVNGSRINIESFKNQILNFCSLYHRGLDFRFQNDEVYHLGDSLVLYDQTGNLSNYEVESSGHSTAWIEENKLRILVANDYVGRETITLKRKNDYSYNSKLYYYDTSQRLISAGNFEENREEITFYISGSDITFQVIDGDSKEAVPRGQGSFENAIYEFYRSDGELIETVTTNEFGKGYVKNLPYGDYFVRQIKESLGYQINPNEVFISFNENTELPVILEEYPIYREIEVFKVYDYEDTGELIPETDVMFTVFNESGDLISNFSTNSLGIGSIVLPYGNYLFHQETTNFGYQKVEDFYVNVDSNVDNFDEKIRIDLLNPYIECQLKIVVQDFNTKNVILKDGFLYKIYDVFHKRYLEFNGNDVFSVENGELIVPVLVGYGDYRIEEVGVAEGYVNKKQSFDIHLDDRSYFEFQDGLLQYVQLIYQELIVGKVDILTTQKVFHSFDGGFEYLKEIRSGIVLDLISVHDLEVYGEIIYHAGEVVQELITDEDGKINSFLYLGDYCVVERESKLKKCFSLKDESHGEKAVFVSLEILLESPTINIQFHNQNDFGEDIEGVVVEVKDVDDHIIYTGITNSEGIFKINNLVPGEYCFYQKKIADNYLISQDKQCILIDDSKPLWEVLMVNKLIVSRRIEVPNTLEIFDKRKILGGFTMILFGGFLYKKKFYRRRHSN